MADTIYKMLHAGAAGLMATLSMTGALLTQSRIMIVVITPPAADQTAVISTASVTVVAPTSTVPVTIVTTTTATTTTETSTVEIDTPIAAVSNASTTTSSTATSTVLTSITNASLVATSSSSSTLPEVASSSLIFDGQVVVPGLLPIVKTIKFSTSTVMLVIPKPIIKKSTSTVLVPLAPSAPKPRPAPTPQPTSAPVPTSTPLPTTITAQWILAQTSVSFSQRLDGTYKVIFTTDLGNGQKLPWDLTQTAIGGTLGVPSFSLSYSCDPQPATPAADAPDQSLSFAVRTSYDCTVSLTPHSGADQRVQTKVFSFTTGVGRVVVTPASSINTLLHDDENDGGFLFTNQENNPVTVTGITMNVSYTGLTTINGPLVMRIVDPATAASLFDFHLENIPADTSSSYTHSEAGIPTPITFVIPGNSARLLPFEILGVHRQLVTGVDPTVTITLKVVTTEPSDTKVTLNGALISWQCIVGAYSFDPNATDLASANACKN